MVQGQIYKIHSDFYYAASGEEIFECKIREVLKKQKEKILVGDYVEFDNGHITKILPRKNYIKRPSVANIDQIIIVSALKEPDLDLHQLNRYIALAKYYKIPTVLCFNKEDLKWDKHIKSDIKKIYEKLGYKTVYTSATEHCGIKVFEKVLEGKISVLCGNSGVGKSSLINAINPDLKLRTKQVSEKTQRGTHTTRHCEIININNTSRIVDTPGFSNIKFDFILPADVDLLFEEIAQYRDECKYSDCLHINEDGCSVLANIDKIDKTRYESYLAFVEEAKEYKEKIKYEGKKEEYSKKIVHNRTMAKISTRKRQSARNTLKQNIYKEFENNANE
ncbi:ribosome small subunit-dependent GTPase A [Spirochaetes bacterium]|uniref:Small ribosomal subunit biogenesis GTPase RsgA n=1 Tax=Candidatus Scatousia excrementipullorum TaxID=2840936 RepID=A0A9D9H0R6_9BACT|nr:ribosome small subunit-dependent GTPase A [Candidatus Scatousia excrementipullorum]